MAAQEDLGVGVGGPYAPAASGGLGSLLGWAHSRSGVWSYPSAASARGPATEQPQLGRALRATAPGGCLSANGQRAQSPSVTSTEGHAPRQPPNGPQARLRSGSACVPLLSEQFAVQSGLRQASCRRRDVTLSSHLSAGGLRRAVTLLAKEHYNFMTSQMEAKK